MNLSKGQSLKILKEIPFSNLEGKHLMKVKPILILPEHWDKVKAGELWVLAHHQPQSGRIVGLWGRSAKRQTAEVSAC